MKILKFILRVFLAFIVAVVELIKIPLCVLVSGKKALESFWVVIGFILYQPLIVSGTFLIMYRQIIWAFSTRGTDIFVWIFLFIAEALFWITLINAALELLFYLWNLEKAYVNIQKLQQYGNNYVLLIVSLLSLFVAAFPDVSIVGLDNFTLLGIGIIYFLSTVCSDIYREFVYKKGVVSDLAGKVREQIKGT